MRLLYSAPHTPISPHEISRRRGEQERHVQTATNAAIMSYRHFNHTHPIEQVMRHRVHAMGYSKCGWVGPKSAPKVCVDSLIESTHFLLEAIRSLINPWPRQQHMTAPHDCHVCHSRVSIMAGGHPAGRAPGALLSTGYPGDYRYDDDATAHAPAECRVTNILPLSRVPARNVTLPLYPSLHATHSHPTHARPHTALTPTRDGPPWRGN